MLFASTLLAVGGSRSLDNAPPEEQIAILIVALIIALIYWICKRGKPD